MTIVILLVLVVVLWIVVLVPSALRRRAENQGAGSIDHFHHQLELLEHAGPKLVEPAYRLHTAMPGADYAPAVTSEFSDRRPKLTLVRTINGEYGHDSADYERVGQVQSPDQAASAAQTRAELAVFRRQEARRRCNFILRVLVVSTLTTGIIGVFSVARLAWIGTGLFALASLALIGLIGYARELELQRQHRRPSTRQVYYEDEFIDQGPGPAEAGFPGGWDEEFYPNQIAAAR
ncbi:MAG TPA: hypothetical protein VGH31_00665 [Acidimicrobiales bacterium]